MEKETSPLPQRKNQAEDSKRSMMKLILLSFFIASLAAVSPQLLPGCCPCGPDGPGGPGKPDVPGTDLIEFVVQTPDTSKGNPNPVIYDLITRLVNKGILPKNVATQLLITFRKS